MAKKIQAWAVYGPKIALGDAMKKEKIIALWNDEHPDDQLPVDD